MGGGGGGQVAGGGGGGGRAGQGGAAAQFDVLDAGRRARGGGVGGADPLPGGGEQPARRQRLDLGGGAVGDDPAAADQDDPVGVGVGLLEVVGREDDGPAALGVGPDGAPELAAPLDVHPGGGLVEDEQLRLGQQRHGEAQPLLLAAGTLADPPARDLGQPGAVQHLGDRPGVREQRRGELDDLADGEVLEQ